ncbi:MAG: GFA family protein, partial [Ilumatobacteraceae bacterium]
MTTRTSSCNCGQLSLTYEGPDPARISLCQCYECQRRTGSVFSVQARLPVEHVTIDGESSTWTFPVEGAGPAAFRSCDSGGATYHFCPTCGSISADRGFGEVATFARSVVDRIERDIPNSEATVTPVL